jgi:hypothetical protein
MGVKAISTMCAASAMLVACGKLPEITDPEATSEEGGSDELGPAYGEGEGEGGAGELVENACLIAPDGTKFGYRHHCGGYMTFGFSGEANGQPVSHSYSYGFGPSYAEPEFEDLDTYETPVVMACCGGPYDFDQAPSSQPTYFRNCKADAVQQMCAAMGQWLIKLAEAYPVAKPQLYEAAGLVGSKANQTACFLALHEQGHNFNEISDTSWALAVGKSWLTVEVDLIEILDIAYDEPPLMCESVFENDEYLLPLLTQPFGDDVDVVALENGHITLTNDTFEHSTTPAEGYMSIGISQRGAVELRNLVLRDPGSVTLVVGSDAYTVDSWNLALIGPISDMPDGEVTTFPAGTVSFAMSVSHAGRLYRAGGTNVRPIELTATDSGEWHLEGLEVAFDDGTMTWSLYSSSTLVFGP